MKKTTATRYCAPPDVLRLLERDGLGWGHDLECRAFMAPAPAQQKEKP